MTITESAARPTSVTVFAGWSCQEEAATLLFGALAAGGSGSANPAYDRASASPSDRCQTVVSLPSAEAARLFRSELCFGQRVVVAA